MLESTSVFFIAPDDAALQGLQSAFSPADITVIPAPHSPESVVEQIRDRKPDVIWIDAPPPEADHYVELARRIRNETNSAVVLARIESPDAYATEALEAEGILLVDHPPTRPHPETVVRAALQLRRMADRLSKKNREGSERDRQIRCLENALSQQTKFRNITDTTRDFMTLINRRYEYEAVNEYYIRAFSTSREAIVGKKVAEVWGQEAFESRIKKILDRCFSGETVRFEGWFSFHRKGKGYYEVTYYPYRDAAGEITHAVVFSLDQTERKRMEEALESVRDTLESRVEQRTRELAEANRGLKREIEDRKRIEKALSAGEARYRTVIQQLPDPIFVLREDRIAFVNSAVVTLLGVESSSKIIGGSIFDFIFPDSRELVRQSLSLISQFSRRPSPAVFSMVRTDDETVLVEATWMQIDYDGSPAVLAVCRDITERKLYQRLLEIQKTLGVALGGAAGLAEAAEAVLTAVLEIDSIDAGGVYIIDPDTGGIQLIAHRNVSPEFVEKVKQFDAEAPQTQVVKKGKPLFRVGNETVPNLRTETQKEGLCYIGTLPVYFENEVIAAINFASRTQQRIRPGVRGSLEDISARTGAAFARIRSFEALKRNEEHLRRIFDTLPILFNAVDPELNFLAWNAECERVTGYTAEEALGNQQIWEKLYPDPEVRRRLFTEDSRLIGNMRNKEWEIVAKDGTPRVISWTSTANDYPIPGYYTWAIGIDVTEKKRAEAAEQEHREQLRRADRLVSLGTAVSGVAHEINNPNHFIRLNAAGLEKCWAGTIPLLDKFYEENGDFMLGGIPYSLAREKVTTACANIRESTERIRGIIDDLKHFTKGSTTTAFDTVSPDRVVKSAVSLCRVLINKSTQRFTVRYGNPPDVSGNFHRLEQVAVNLIQNACFALPDRNRAISVSTRHDPDARQVIIEVADEGIGIPPENQHRLCDPFFTTRRDTNGTGLGLAVSNRIITEHGGELLFDSEVDKGTHVRMLLPIFVEKRKNDR